MARWMSGRKDDQMDGPHSVGRWLDGWAAGWLAGKMSKRLDGWLAERVEDNMDGWPGGWVDS